MICAVRLAPAHRLQQLEHRVVDRADTRQQVEVLADEPQFREPETRRLALGQRGHVATRDRDSAAGRSQQRRDHQQQGRLARAAGAVQRDHLAGGDRQRDAVDRADRLAADGGVVLDEIAQLEHRACQRTTGLRTERRAQPRCRRVHRGCAIVSGSADRALTSDVAAVDEGWRRRFARKMRSRRQRPRTSVSAPMTGLSGEGVALRRGEVVAAHRGKDHPVRVRVGLARWSRRR